MGGRAKDGELANWMAADRGEDRMIEHDLVDAHREIRDRVEIVAPGNGGREHELS